MANEKADIPAYEKWHWLAIARYESIRDKHQINLHTLDADFATEYEGDNYDHDLLYDVDAADPKENMDTEDEEFLSNEISSRSLTSLMQRKVRIA
ncbi:hypothetical protein HBH98_245770 [Parastagonospora nodorum]|nr:hypothetical protein HBH53_249430 [Parastagonospora nodorum]KAH3956382.1 hypothetical protein HBH51_243210 [Parastagonospora nodorum]KAH4215551.1 hypothetical protein HBI06_247260 [Parastagonospora nodorum]KAH4223682.1 hypothetical protein HBI05_243700 [Parastagonospora nodorum]KAH4333592.1 hypothetical protein HBH98_245770 [Parastagonospora nodorum]